VEGLLWGIRTLDSIVLATPIVLNLALCLTITQSDYFVLIAAALLRSIAGAAERSGSLPAGERPSGIVIIPSLLRSGEDFDAITTTIESAATNGYPGEIVIVASVDGRTELPGLYADLQRWVARRSYPANVHVYVTGTPTRLGKMMAVEAGVSFMKELVACGVHAEFPAIYFSIDGDGTLGEHAIERLAAQLTRRHPITGNRRRIVAGKICIRPDLLWRGWRAFFTVEGQLYIQAAREFLVSNVSRFNRKVTPRIGVPGALYCTWSELLLVAPRYMGFMQSLRVRDWLRWWIGGGAPRFSESRAPALPEALTGASDDTCMAFLASLARWKDGALDFDAPATPLHALGRFFVSYFVERSHCYEPEARVYTYSPSTLKALWRQRVRWNSSRVECAGRFWRAFLFHWEIGLPVGGHLVLLLHTVFEVGGYYVLLPYYCLGTSHAVLGFVLGYLAQTISYTLYTVMSLALEREWRRYWRTMLCLPVASLYCVFINCFGCVYGVTRDIALFGNSTNFAPEWTLMKGRCERVALAFRLRRFVALAIRSALFGDVPLGTFWLGWTETRWTPSGFEGWTTGETPRPILPPVAAPLLARLRPAAEVAEAPLASRAGADVTVLAPRVAREAAPVRHAA
jgi:hypothetical protein